MCLQQAGSSGNEKLAGRGYHGEELDLGDEGKGGIEDTEMSGSDACSADGAIVSKTVKC